MTVATLSLHPEHLADLRKSGLSDSTIKAAGVYSVRPSDLARAVGFNPQGVMSALVFPYLGDDGFVRLKVFPPYADKLGHTIKYLQRRGTGARLYIPPSVEAVLSDAAIPIAVSEGEKKALKLAQEGIPSLGIGGLWNWIAQGTPIPDLDRVAWTARPVTVFPDSDVWGRSDLLQAVYAFGKEIETRGAKVMVAVIPHGERKVGIDDYLVTREAVGVRAGEALASLETIPLSAPRFKPAARWWEGWHQRAVQGDSNGGSPEANGVWPEPKPIVAALHPVPPFDSDTLLPDTLRGWIMDEADRMPCPPDFIAVGALVALGAIIGARCTIKPKSRDNWLIVPNLWGGIVGMPAAKKSPAIAAALKPLERLIARAMEAHQTDAEAYEADKTVFEAKKEAIEARIKAAAKDAKKGDPEHIVKELREHQRRTPETPTLRRYKTNDTTIEKLGELLRENPAGLLVLRDELVGLVASWEREGREGDRAFFLEAWNGSASFDTDRIGRGSIFIPNLCVSILGGIQPDKLIAYLEQATRALANDGMLQRFQLMVYPDHRAWEWRDRPPDKVARDRAFAVFETLADFDPVAFGAAPADPSHKFPYFRFDEDAQEIFIEWSGDLHRGRLPAEEHPIIAQHLTKFDKLFPALALILHLADCQRGPVTAAAAYRAAAWCDYLEAHARRCYGLLVDDGLRAAQALADKVRQGKLQDGFTARDVRRNQWRYLTSDEGVQAALDWLEDEGWLRSADAGTVARGGRPTRVYCINPVVKCGNKSGGDHG